MINFLSHSFKLAQTLDKEYSEPDYQFTLSDSGPGAGTNVSQEFSNAGGRVNGSIQSVNQMPGQVQFSINTSGQPILTNGMKVTASAEWNFVMPSSENPPKVHVDTDVHGYQASGSARANLSWKLMADGSVITSGSQHFPDDTREALARSRDVILEAGKKYTLSMQSDCDAVEDGGISSCKATITIAEPSIKLIPRIKRTETTMVSS